MPELPEVETVLVGLNELIVGKKIKSVKKDWLKSFPNNNSLVNKHLIDAQIISLKRRAKVLIINLSSDYSLMVHLKMTGQLVFMDKKKRFGAGHPTDSLISRLPDNSTRVIVSFNDGSKLFFNDQRKFGWMKLVKTDELMDSDFINSLGPEPLSEDFSWPALKERLNIRPNAAIKAVLLDQKIIAGIGNIYADESLWLAKIHPLSTVNSLSDQKIKLLCRSIIDVLYQAIKAGGSSDRNYVNARGQKGSYIKTAKVYHREGQPCLRCGHKIVKERRVNRGTHYCPYCQKPKIAKI